MSFKLAKTLVTQDKPEKSEAVENCIEEILHAGLEPSPDEIKWAVEVTPELLGRLSGPDMSGAVTGASLGAGLGFLGPLGMVAGMGIGLAVDAWRYKDVAPAEMPRSPDGAMMLQLCTALLSTNKLSPDQIDQLKAVANTAIEELWENKEDCKNFINATTRSITAVEKWVEVHDSLGSSNEKIEFKQEMTSLASANASLKLEIKATVDVPFYLGKASAETLLQMRGETASSETKNFSTHQTFELTVGKRLLLAKKIMHVNQGAAWSQDFFVDVQCFTLEEFIRVTGLTPKNGVR